MCGICGYITTKRGEGKSAKAHLSRLLIASSVRGKDAAGIAYITKTNMLNVVKQAGDAKELTEAKPYTLALKHNSPDIVIGHARAKTQGDAKDNNNNHPIYTRTGLALVHNGIIHNDDALFNKYKLERSGEVDSEIIVRLIEHYRYTAKKSMVNAIKEATSKISGGMACALIDRKTPDKLYLWASSNPLALAYQHSTGTIFFASTPAILEGALVAHQWAFGLFPIASNRDDFTIVEVSNDTGIVLSIGQRQTTITETFLLDRPTHSYTSYGGRDGWDSIGTSKYWVQEAKRRAKAKRATWSEPAKLALTDPKTPIVKPSLYDNKTLEAREKVLSELKNNGAATDKELSELKRISDMLTVRMKRRIARSDREPLFTTMDENDARGGDHGNDETAIILSGEAQYND